MITVGGRSACVLRGVLHERDGAACSGRRTLPLERAAKLLRGRSVWPVLQLQPGEWGDADAARTNGPGAYSNGVFTVTELVMSALVDGKDRGSYNATASKRELDARAKEEAASCV